MLWYAVLVGAVVSVLLFVMLKMRPMQQFLLGTITSFFLGVILFVIVSLDDPLRGEEGVGPDALVLLWERQMVWDEGPGWSLREAAVAEFALREVEGMRQVRIDIRDEAVRARSGALSNMTGKIAFTPRVPGAGDLFRSIFTKEARVRPFYEGTGTILLQPSLSGYHIFDAAEGRALDPRARGLLGVGGVGAAWPRARSVVREPLGRGRALCLEDHDRRAGQGGDQRAGAGRDDRHPRMASSARRGGWCWGGRMGSSSRRAGRRGFRGTSSRARSGCGSTPGPAR